MIIMNIKRYIKTMRWAIPEFVSLNLVEDSKACESINTEWYIEGYFNPYFEDKLDKDWSDDPIEINIVCHRGDQLIEDQDLITNELLTVYAHELIHFEQFKEGRFDLENFSNNEEEAYRRETEWKKPWHQVVADKLRAG
jgi:Golgi nucleoside diphosphatase